MGLFQRIRKGFNEALYQEYEKYLLEVIPPNTSTTVKGLQSILKAHVIEGEVLYIVDTGEGLKEGYYTTIYTVTVDGLKYTRVYHENSYSFKKQCWTDEPFYNETLWMKIHKNDRLFVTSDKQEAMRMVRSYCFEAWKNKKKNNAK